MQNFPRVLALLVAFCMIGMSASAVADTAPIPVFANGTHDYRCYRIPAIVALSDGTLLAFAEGRVNGCSDFGDVQIVMRVSRDQGRTWGPLRVVARHGRLQADNAVPVVDSRDPRYPNGRILLIYCTGNAPESAVIEGEGTRRVWYVASTDDGATWSAPVEITASVKKSSWRAYATGPGHGLQLASGPYAGRIIVAANHTDASAESASQSEAHAFYSDDHGRTWRLGDSLAVSGSNESTLAEGKNGTVVMNSRDQTGISHARIIAISHDGAGHWKTHFIAQDLPDPVCEGSMIRYAPKKGRSVLLFSNPDSTSERVDLSISVSRDGGLTWPKHTRVHAGPSAYSDIVVMRHGKLGILFERGSDGGIVFTVRNIKALL